MEGFCEDAKMRHLRCLENALEETDLMSRTMRGICDEEDIREELDEDERNTANKLI